MPESKLATCWVRWLQRQESHSKMASSSNNSCYTLQVKSVRKRSVSLAKAAFQPAMWQSAFLTFQVTFTIHCMRQLNISFIISHSWWEHCTARNICLWCWLQFWSNGGAHNDSNAWPDQWSGDSPPAVWLTRGCRLTLEEFSWNNNGETSITGRRNGLVGLALHCFIHQQALCLKCLTLSNALTISDPGA